MSDFCKTTVHGDWGGQLDFATLEGVSGSYVTNDLRECALNFSRCPGYCA